MKFTRELPGTLIVQSVDANGIRINDHIWSQAIALTPQEVLEGWQAKPLAELTEADFQALLEHSPEVILLGSGETGQFAPRELMFAFARRGVGFEVMDTAAAARTFNVLAGESRRVAAVLYPQ